jgi:multicomponent Na+:H+ antiporter subunit G
MAIAALGVVRMPDLFLRMSATTKGSVVGLVIVLLGTALHFGDVAVWAKVIAVMLFIMLTLPVAAHMIGRAGYFDRTPLWEGTVIDELSGRYDPHSHELQSTPSPLPPEDSEPPSPLGKLPG